MRAQRLLACVLAGTATGLLAVTLRAHDPITTRVTWTREVSRIVQTRCVKCHSPGGRGPMSLTSYEEARPWAKAIKEEVLTRRMPKWQAARGYGDFSNDPALSAFEIALIAAWADGGAPKGTEAQSEPQTNPASAGAPGKATDKGREINIACGNEQLPPGQLLAVRPRIDKGSSIGMTVRLPDGRMEIVGYVRNFDPDFETTYWLRVPLETPPGSRMVTELVPGSPGNRTKCSIAITVTGPR